MAKRDRGIRGVMLRIASIVAGLVAIVAGVTALAVVAAAASFMYAARPDLVVIALYLGASCAFAAWSAQRLRRH